MRTQSFATPGLVAIFGLGLLLGCEPMPSSGNPFAVATAESEATQGVDPRFDRPEPQVFTSEELHAKAEAAAVDEAPAASPAASGAVTVSSGGPTGVEAVVVAVADPAPDPAPAAAPAPAPSAPAPALSPARPSSGGWPMRLVRALPDTNPPRAILGLPDGREVVVSPGTMLPELGVVVMAIGRDRLQVARVEAIGDHAAVTELTLDAQY